MCKKLVTLCIVLALTSAVLAEETILTDFESGTLEGWVTNTASATLTPGATKGVTGPSGMYSMQIKGPGSTWWSENAMIDVAGIEGGQDLFFGSDIFKIDVTVLQSDFVLDTAIGWTTSPAVGLLLNPGSGQWWNLGNVQIGQPLNGDITMTASWDYRKIRDQIDGTRGVMKMILEFVDYGYVSPAKFYVDTARFTNATPEPATMALLGLGSLALLRKKK